MQTNVQIDAKALRHSPEHGKKGVYRPTAEVGANSLLSTYVICSKRYFNPLLLRRAMSLKLSVPVDCI